jgi:hypothetical protein
MAVARGSYRANKRKHAPKAPKSFNDMVSRLASSYAEPQPATYTDSTRTLYHYSLETLDEVRDVRLSL